MSDETNGANGANGNAPQTAAEVTEPRPGTVEAELAETKDRLLRALAETENVRRRAQRERDDAQRFAVSNFAKDLLSVADNLHRALESLPEAEAPDQRTRNLLAGVAATERELLAALERHGIRKLEPRAGDRFDPNAHEAMFEVESTGQPAGSIIQVLQPGYLLHDRLLRPAMVGVAKAAPGTGEAPRVNEVV